MLDQITGKQGGIIIQQYKPQGDWLWTQFYGTVIYSAWPRALLNMAWTTAFCVLVRYKTHGDFNVFHLDNVGNHELISTFVIVEKMWSVLMSLTTFLLTFFVSQSWAFWKSFIDVSRGIQGRFNSIQMHLASHAARDESGRYTPEAEAFLRDMAQRLKLFHTLYWASQALRFYCLLTEKGWDGMVARGLVTQEERMRLKSLNKLTPTQKHNGVFQSMLVASRNGIRDRKVCVESGLLEDRVLSEFGSLRGTSGTISDLVAGR